MNTTYAIPSLKRDDLHPQQNKYKQYMKQWDISSTYEEETNLFFAEVLNRGDAPYYAQGKTEADTLSSLFGVIKACQEMDEELKKSDTTMTPPQNHHVSFSIPVLSS